MTKPSINNLVKAIPILAILIIITFSWGYNVGYSWEGSWNTLSEDGTAEIQNLNVSNYYLNDVDINPRLQGTWDVALTAPTLDTGQGANELYDMDQNVLTTSDVDFNSIDLSEIYWNSANRTILLLGQNETVASAIVGTDLNLDYLPNYWYADGVNDNVQIQAAVNSLTTGRTWKEKVLLKGNFTVSSATNIPSYTIIDIQGKVTLEDGSDQNVFMIASSLSDIEIINGEIDGNKAGQTPGASLYLIIKTAGANSQRIRITNIFLHDAERSGIVLNTVSDVTIEDNLIVDCGQQAGIGDAANALGSSQRVSFKNNKCIDYQDTGFALMGIDHLVEHNIFDGGTYGVYLGETNLTNDNIIDHNKFLNQEQSGIYIRIMAEGNKITNNIINNASNDGIRLSGANVSDNEFIGNTITGCRYGINTDVGAGNNVEGLLISSNRLMVNNRSGIYLSRTSNGLVTNNLCKNNSQESAGTYDGITLWTALNMSLNNNKCFDDQAVMTQRYGIMETTGSDLNFFSNNDVRDNQNANNIFITGANTIVNHNPGFVTENEGSQTLSNGTTAVNVTHGCYYTPNAGDIQIHPIETLGSASFWWVEQITSTTFEINVNADPGQDVDFAWSVDRH